MAEQHWAALPKTHTTYANIIKSLVPLGDHSDGHSDALPDVTYTVDALYIDAQNLHEYRQICGFDDTPVVPITYFSVLSQHLQMNMMVKEPFPFALLGLVHIYNSVCQYRLIMEDETLSLSVSFANLRAHSKGQQFDFITTVKSQNTVVWRGVSTYLSRHKKPRKDNAKTNLRSTDDNKKSQSQKLSMHADGTHALFNVPEDIGRRYAFVSGDFNLIHLHPLAARAFGFPKAIAHGMWSKAKCLALLPPLPGACQVTVDFKLPLLLPTEAELIAQPLLTSADSAADFGLYSVKNNKPYLTGTISLPKDDVATESDAPLSDNTSAL